MTPPQTQTWFITGANSGLGAAISKAAVDAGHNVVATARRPETLGPSTQHFLPLQLDVTDSAAITAAVNAAAQTFGGIDVLVNNAGYGMHGALEELQLADVRAMFDTNVFGLIEVTAAVLPLMRGQGRGLIYQISSVAGIDAAPGGSAYAATKHAVEGLSKGLVQEVREFGIQVCLVEPGPFRTDFAGRSLSWQPSKPPYDTTLAKAREQRLAMHGNQAGDPDKLARVLVQQSRSDNLPLHLVFGAQGYDRVRKSLTSQLTLLDSTESIGRDTDF